MAEKEVHKTKVRKTTRKTSVKKTAVKTVATKKIPKKNIARKSSAALAKKTVRKAPTPIAQVRAQEKKTTTVLWVGVGVLCVILIISVVVGTSATGKINIEKRTTDVRELATPQEQAVIDSIPVQTTSLPDGGLVPSGVPLEVSETAPVSTTTDALASTTSDILTATSSEILPETIDADISTSTGTTSDNIAQ